MKIEALFAFSLIAGFVLSLFLLLSGSRFRIRLFRRLLRRKSGAKGLAVPVPFGLFLTAFGFSGLIFERGFEWPWTVTLFAAATTGTVLFAAAGFFLSRFFADTADSLQGGILRGVTGHVSLAIPENGIGRIAYIADGKRATVAARTVRGEALPGGTRIMIIEFRDRIALVEQL